MQPEADHGLGGATGAVKSHRKSHQTTRLLLDSATEMFGQNGYEATRIADVARRCGRTPGAIYSRWPSKLDLFRAVVEYTIPQRPLHTVSDMTTDEKLAVLGASLLSPSGRRFRSVLVEAFIAARHDESIAAMVTESLDTATGNLAAMVAEGKESGYIDPALDTVSLVALWQAIGLGTHLIFRRESTSRPVPDAENWNALIARLIEAIAPPPSDDPQ